MGYIGMYHCHTDDASLSQIWVVMGHQYGISSLVSQTSFRRETVGGIAKCGLFSQATGRWEK